MIWACMAMITWTITGQRKGAMPFSFGSMADSQDL